LDILRHDLLALTSCRDDVKTTTLASPPSAAVFFRSVINRFVSRKCPAQRSFHYRS